MVTDAVSKLDAHEALCRRCGISCHFAVPVNGLPVVVDDLHCRFLEQEDDGRFKCSVYTERYERAPWCHSAEEALENGLLAQDCPYAAGTSGYRGKTRVHTRLQAKVLPAIRAEVITYGLPAGASVDGIKRFMARTGGGTWDVVLSPDGSRLMVRPRGSE
jgi:uncharacterized cysteine cluster protein YcgN (CxxCxxCC family)